MKAAEEMWRSATRIGKLAALAAALCADLSLFCAASGSPGGAPAHLPLLWAVAALRCLLLSAATLPIRGRLEPAPLRYVAVHCLVWPLYRSARGAHGPPEDAWSWLRCGAAAAAAALFWDVGIPAAEDEENGGRKQKARVLLVRVLRLYGPDWLLLLGGLVFLTLAVLCEMYIPFYTGKVIDILSGHYQWNEFLSAIFFMALYSLGSSFSAGCRGGLLLCGISRFTCRVKVQLFEALTKQEIGFFDTVKTGEITSRLSRDTSLTGRTVCLNINVLLRTFVKTLGMLSLMTNLSWKLTCLVLLETPIMGLIQNSYDTHYQRLSKLVQDSVAKANEAVNEVVSGIRVVRSFNTELAEACRYDDRLKVTQGLKTRRDVVRIVYVLARRITGLAIQVAMLYYGRLFIQKGEMTTGNLVSFILYQSNLGDNIQTLFYIFGDMLNSVGAASKVFEYIDREPQVGFDGTLAPESMTGRITFHRLTFAYPSNPSNAVLKDFSLALEPGHMTALVGRSGEGKSTCVSLLQRFYEPQDGEILLDGRPLKSYEHSFLHRKVALVSQEPVLFSGSVRDNIAYGLADCSLDEIQEAARKANAHAFISRLEKGYDTELGEGGGRLSKSERQRLAIARALVRQPQVLILDEITSSLDTDSETKVQEALASLRITLLVIAHRLKTIEKANQIVVFGEGRVQECGTHQELMENKGVYYKLRDMLFREGDAPQ
ncbi:antigen peptide transporter 2a [Lampris incognitus]|uniref:antigen peptide transporter 2a n=1 Tax=Lampris incognitus TaxID=2546036 RepID=UPI0024B59685|nr:antigen peptide transporter 2a [Lampris incognitus]